LVAGLDASLELALADILALGEGNVQWLVVDHPLVHVSDGLGSLLGVVEADESESLALAKGTLLRLDCWLLLRSLGLGLTLLDVLLVLLILLLFLLLGLSSLSRSVTHDLCRSDGAKGSEQLTELLIINLVIEVLDVEVHTLVLGCLLNARSLVRLAELLLTLVLLLGTTDIEVLTLEVLSIQLIDSLSSVLVVDEVNETETTALVILLVAGERGGRNVAKLLEEITELLISNFDGNVLDIDVGEVCLHLLKLGLTVLFWDVVANEDLLLVQKHTIDVLDSLAGSLVGLVVDETVTLGGSSLILSNLATENVTKGSEGIVKSLVVDGGIQVLDEDVSLTRLAKSRVTLRPHNSAWAALNEGVV